MVYTIAHVGGAGHVSGHTESTCQDRREGQGDGCKQAAGQGKSAHRDVADAVVLLGLVHNAFSVPTESFSVRTQLLFFMPRGGHTWSPRKPLHCTFCLPTLPAPKRVFRIAVARCRGSGWALLLCGRGHEAKSLFSFLSFLSLLVSLCRETSMNLINVANGRNRFTDMIILSLSIFMIKVVAHWTLAAGYMQLSQLRIDIRGSSNKRSVSCVSAIRIYLKTYVLHSHSSCTSAVAALH